MEAPRIDPVGLLEVPEGFASTRRDYTRGVRSLAFVLLFTFLGVGTFTTVASLGTWCLTSHASTPPLDARR